MSAFATAGAVAWVAPEILTAKPAAGAVLLSASPTPPGSSGSTGSGPSGSGATTAGSTTSGSTPSPVTSASSTTNTSGSGSGSAFRPSRTRGRGGPGGSPLAITGANLERDAAIGAALVAGGWALHRWASRSPQVVGDAVEATAADPPQTA